MLGARVDLCLWGRITFLLNVQGLSVGNSAVVRLVAGVMRLVAGVIAP